MSRSQKFSLAVALVCIPTVTWVHAQSMTDGRLSITDGALTLHGSFDGLAGIEALSAGGHLSLDEIAIPEQGIIKSTAPFTNGATVIYDSPNEVTIGALGSDNRITLDGDTTTSILYAESVDVAAGVPAPANGHAIEFRL